MKYDSGPDTVAHIRRVGELLTACRRELEHRGITHDLSKLQSAEKETFDEFTPKLKGSTYGSDEYKSFLAAMKPALDHHYAQSRHHPEHHAGGISDMTLIDMLEMLCDWKAAGERHANGSLAESLKKNGVRFGIDPALARVVIGGKIFPFRELRKIIDAQSADAGKLLDSLAERPDLIRTLAERVLKRKG